MRDGLKNEAKGYGPLRLLEVLSRLATLVATEYGDSFLQEIAEEVKKKQNLVMTDKKAFYNFLNELVVQFTKDANKR